MKSLIKTLLMAYCCGLHLCSLALAQGPETNLDQLEKEIQRRKEELQSSIKNDSHHRLGHNYWDSKDLSQNSYPIPLYNQILRDLQRIPQIQNKQSQRRLIHKVLLLNQSVKVLGDHGVKAKSIDVIWSDLTRYKLSHKKHSTDKKNSRSLNLNSKVFESQTRDSQKFRPQGHEIERIKTNTRHVVFDLKNRKGQKPLSLQVGPGIYSEATTSALLKKMGVHAYPSQVLSNITTTIQGMTAQEFKHQYAMVHAEDGPELKKLIKELVVTKTGLKITWHQGLLVQQQELDKFVGTWSPFENDFFKSKLIRSLPLFYLWVGQKVFSKYEGRDLYLDQQPGDSSDFRFLFYHSGLDKAFGKSLPETPGSFPWNLVASQDSDGVRFNHRISGLAKFPINIEDTRPMAKRILSLSREDIEQAVQLGGWPKSIQTLLIEKLINRRNQLIQLYHWKDQKKFLKVRRNLSTDDSRVVEGELIDGVFIKTHQDFEGGILKKLTPYLKGLSHLFYEGGRGLLSSFNGLDIAPVELGIDDGLIKRVLFGYNRSIERNENPTGPDDQYLVKDTFKIGFRLGAGLVISGDISYVKEYTLIYPVKSRADGELQNKFILNLLLPYQVHADELPEKHVLVLSDSIEGRGRFKVGNTMSVIGQSLSMSEINLGRTFISQKTPKKAYVFSDSSLFSELAYKMSLELGALGLPVFQHDLRQGTLKRHYYELNLNNKGHREALRKVKLFNSTKELKKIGHVHKINDTFYESNRRSNFLGIFQSESRTRYDDIIEHHQNDPTPDATTLVRRLQLEQFKRSSWSLFNKNEEFKSEVLLRATSKNMEMTDGKNFEDIKRPHIELKLLIEDQQTDTFEFERYVEMINDIARDSKFLFFTPSLHGRNDEWGELNIGLNMDLNKKGLEKLIQANQRDYWRALARVTKKPVSYWARALSTNLRNRRRLETKTKDIYMAKQLNSLIRHLRNVGREKGDLWRMRSVHAAFSKAIYTSGQAFRSTILAVIHEMAGKENIFLEAMISVPPDQEGHLPGKRALYNKLGKTKEQGHPFYQFYFEQASQVYNAF